MWAQQRLVAPLPLPPLDVTLQRYVAYVDPLLDSSAASNTRAIVHEFAASAEARELQRELAAIGAANYHEREGSFVSGFWDSMYLELRCRQPVNTTPYLLLANDAQRRDGVARAANLLHALATHRKLVRTGALPVDMERDVPMDMRQYEMLYGVARVPRAGRDLLVRADDARHVVVLRRNRFYVVDIVGADHAPRSEADIAADLRAVVQKADAAGLAPPVPALSGGERERWASLRSRLMAHSPINCEALSAIDSAIWVIALDETQPADLDAQCAMLLHGIDPDRKVRARWWDKQQLVFLPDGAAASLLEHSPVDGHVSLSLYRMVDEMSRAAPPPPRAADSRAPAELKFDLDAALLREVEAEEAAYVADNASVDHVALRLDSLGTEFAKQHGLSPDALCQAMFQIAYFKEHERTESTYESVNMKHFMGGRTETLRSVTPQSALLQRMWDADAMRQPDGRTVPVTKAMKIDALRSACAAHVARGREAKQGHGVDRHVWSLYQVALAKRRRLSGYDVPAFFTDPAFARLLTSVISTSNVSAPFFDLFGFGAVCGNGIGIAYNLNRDRMSFSFSSFTQQAAGFRSAFVETVNETRDLLK
jgi:carnitine O-acetyltransferase